MFWEVCDFSSQRRSGRPSFSGSIYVAKAVKEKICVSNLIEDEEEGKYKFQRNGSDRKCVKTNKR